MCQRYHEKVHVPDMYVNSFIISFCGSQCSDFKHWFWELQVARQLSFCDPVTLQLKTLNKPFTQNIKCRAGTIKLFQSIATVLTQLYCF